MGVPPMSLTPVRACPVFLLFFDWRNNNNNSSSSKDTGGTPVVLMGKMPMLRFRGDRLGQDNPDSIETLCGHEAKRQQVRCRRGVRPVFEQLLHLGRLPA